MGPGPLSFPRVRRAAAHPLPPVMLARGFTTQTPRSPVKQPWHEGIVHFFHIFSAYFEDLEVIQFLEQEGVPAVASLGGTEALPTPSPGTSPRRHLNEPRGSV